MKVEISKNQLLGKQDYIYGISIDDLDIVQIISRDINLFREHRKSDTREAIEPLIDMFLETFREKLVVEMVGVVDSSNL